MATLPDWNAAACEALGLDPAQTAAQQNLVLAVARDVAHGVARPAAPLTAYLLGLAVGRGADPAETAATLTALAESFSPAIKEKVALFRDQITALSP